MFLSLTDVISSKSLPSVLFTFLLPWNEDIETEENKTSQ